MGTIRQGIFSDDQVAGIAEKLSAYPLELEGAKNAIAEIELRQSTDNTLKNVEEDLKEMEAELEFIIRNETNDDGKPKYSNESLRTKALRIKLSLDTDYLTAKKTVIEVKKQQSELAFEHAKAKNKMYRIADCLKVSLAGCGLIQGLCMEDNATMIIEEAKRLEVKAVAFHRISDLVDNVKKKDTNNA